jgi:multiple sugar transport system substrate-binding protein
MKGFINGAGAVKGLSCLQGAVRLLHAAGHSNAYMSEDLGLVQVGPGGDADELHRLLPGHLEGPAGRRREDRLLPDPQGHVQHAQLGGQGISVVKYSDKKDMALEYMKWFAQPAIQQKWWDGGGFTCLQRDPRTSRASRPARRTRRCSRTR